MSESATVAGSRWWLPIAAIVGLLLVQGAVSIVLPPDSGALWPIMGPLVVAGLTLQLLSPVWLYYDRQYLAAVSGWTPSGWYYLMALPPLSVFLSPLYLYQRHQHVGVP